MKGFFSTILLLLFAGSLFAQEQLINSFDAAEDSTYWEFYQNDGANDDTSFLNISYVTTGMQEGAGAMQLDYSVHNTESWGGFVKIEHWHPDSLGFYDWSSYDTLSLWYNNTTAQSEAGRVELRVNIHDASENGDMVSEVGDVEYYYSFHKVLDNTPGWNQIKIPFISDPPAWDGNGFNLTGWAGITGNGKIDKDMIKGWSFEFSINGGGERDFSTGSILLDKFFVTGISEKPWLIFNGKTLDPSFSGFAWGQSAMELIDGAGEDPKTNALKWTQGDEWGNGWSGAGWNIDPAVDIGFRWDLDSLKFKMKAETGTNSPIIMQFESASGNGVRGMEIPITADDNWHEYAIPLRDLYVRDGKTDFDSTEITVFQMMGAGNATAGKVVWLDYIWTGNPEIDVVAPNAPINVAAIGGTYINSVTWSDVPTEEGESYTVYYSENEITDLTADGVNVVEAQIPEGTQIVDHILKSPAVDQSVTYYYAVTCTDQSGNESEIGPADASVTNTAKGVTVIHGSAPPSFAADGDLSEWAGIAPFRMFPDDGSGTVVSQNSVIDNDADLSVNAYLAVDADYLYIAFDVEDDEYSFNPSIASYMTDGCDLFLGLYEAAGVPHTSYKRGDAPDYHWRFTEQGALMDNPSGTWYDSLGESYNLTEKFPTGYIIEHKVSWADIAGFAGDDLFTPTPGTKLIIDYSINDADATGEREGILTYSPINDDQSWADPSRWAVTWIGDPGTDVEQESDQIPIEYDLSQNYPNPFNPTTKIKFSIKETSDVSLKVFNLLGEEVASLVNEVKSPGVYSVDFSAQDLSSGVYLYQIKAGSFISSRKMILLK